MEEFQERFFTGIRDFVAGTIGGMLQVAVGHPLDTVKVRLQTVDGTPKSHAQFSGVWNCLSTTVKEEGVKGLYKGMASPLLGVTALNAILFATYGQVVKHWRGDDETKPLTLAQYAGAGAIAGLVQCGIVGPTELIKSKLQVQYAGHGVRYNGPWDCVKKIFRAEGPWGLGKGMSVTIAREVPAYATCFYTYEGLRLWFKPEDGTVDDIGAMATIVAGGVAGMVCWAVSYPQDVIKSRLQIEPEGSTRYRHWCYDGGMIDCYQQTVRAEGQRALWKGFSACMARAFPANAASFLGYATTIRALDALAGVDEDIEDTFTANADASGGEVSVSEHAQHGHRHHRSITDMRGRPLPPHAEPWHVLP